jgi:hypothetical protein
MTKLRRAAAALLAVATFITVGVPAQAERITVSDEAGGDAPSWLLDITQFRISNRDRAVVVKLTFLDDEPGAIIVGVQPRHRRLGVNIMTVHRRRGPDRTYLKSGGDKIPCIGLSSEWRRREAELTLRLPARCMAKGNYGAVRGQAITFTPRFGQDMDFAPNLRDGADTSTEWVSRG